MTTTEPEPGDGLRAEQVDMVGPREKSTGYPEPGQTVSECCGPGGPAVVRCVVDRPRQPQSLVRSVGLRIDEHNLGGRVIAEVQEAIVGADPSLVFIGTAALVLPGPFDRRLELLRTLQQPHRLRPGKHDGQILGGLVRRNIVFLLPPAQVQSDLCVLRIMRCPDDEGKRMISPARPFSGVLSHPHRSARPMSGNRQRRQSPRFSHSRQSGATNEALWGTFGPT